MTELRRGDVIYYPYLWKRQKLRRETEGRKDRPVCVVFALRTPIDDLTHLVLLAVSTRPPDPDQNAIEIPEIECRRGGLSEAKRRWVTVSEYNYDVAGRSAYLKPYAPVLGRFSEAFVRKIATVLSASFPFGEGRVDRTE